MRVFARVAAIAALAISCASQMPPGRSSSGESARPTPTVAPTLASASPARAGKVTMGDNYFQPDELIVAIGASVTWEIVQGDAQHDVVSVDGLFRSNSPMGRGGDSFTSSFTAPGVYRYVCSYHIPEGMIGRVVVR